MEISLDILLLFWIEKKLIFWLHICNIEWIGLVVWLWSFESNNNSYITKKCPFCVFTYCEKTKSFSSSSISFLSLLCIFWTILHIFEPRHIKIARLNHFHEPLGTVQVLLNRAIFAIARLNRCHEPYGTVQEHFNRAIFSIARFNFFM